MKNNPFEDLSNSVEKLIKKRENGTKQNYKESYRRLRNKLQKIYVDNESDEALILNRNELAKLDNETAKIIISMYKNNKKAIENTLKDVIETAYKTVNSTVAKYNIEAVSRVIDSNRIIEKQVAGHIWTDRIKKYGNDFVYDVHGIIHEGIDNGDTFTSMARNLKKRFGKDIGNTVRIARTEGARVLEDSKYQAFEDIAENESVQVFKVWHTMGDEAVRDTHQAMEGIKVPYDDEFTLPSGATCLYPKSTGIAAEDINCRCYVEYVTEIGYNISKWEYELGDRVGRFGILTNNPKIQINRDIPNIHSWEKLKERNIDIIEVEKCMKYGACIEQDRGNKYVYITKEGAAVVRKDGKLITAWAKNNYDENMIEIIKKLYGSDYNEK